LSDLDDLGEAREATAEARDEGRDDGEEGEKGEEAGARAADDEERVFVGERGGDADLGEEGLSGSFVDPN